MKAFFKGILLVVILIVVFLAGPVINYFPQYNLRVVEAGSFYGARQMGESALVSTIEQKGIRTVINLRGENPEADWYQGEAAACRRTGANLVSFGWSQGRIPDPESLSQFVDVLETGQGPFLVHCAGGTHRTGVGAAVYLLLKGEDIATARKQFRVGFNDAPIGEVLDLYEKSDMPFREWVRDAYPQIHASLTEQAAQ